jgi:hypothetical protein
VSEQFATETVIIFSSVDNGLNTVLFAPSEGISTQSTAVFGVAYNLPGDIVSQVEYRWDGGPWFSASAQDGYFDSNYEPFAIPIVPQEAGTYLLEAYAIDGNGTRETELAMEEIVIGNGEKRVVFLPLIARGK